MKTTTETNTCKKLDKLFDISSCYDKSIKCKKDSCFDTHVFRTYGPDKKVGKEIFF